MAEIPSGSADQDRYFTSDDLEDLLELLYGPDSFYNQIAELIDEYGAPEGNRSMLVRAADERPPLAVVGQHVEGGTISVSGGDTLDAIDQGRWLYQVLLPSIQDGLSQLHTANHNGGQFTTKPPLEAIMAGGHIIEYTGTKGELEQFKRRYLSALEVALQDLVAVLRR